MILTAAPTEVLNPGLFDALKAALSIPFTTALNACVAALRVYSAPQVLLLTPFDARLNDLIVEHLAKVGVTAIAPHSFDELAVPKRMTPDEVFDLTKKNSGRRRQSRRDLFPRRGARSDQVSWSGSRASSMQP